LVKVELLESIYCRRLTTRIEAIVKYGSTLMRGDLEYAALGGFFSRYGLIRSPTAAQRWQCRRIGRLFAGCPLFSWMRFRRSPNWPVLFKAGFKAARRSAEAAGSSSTVSCRTAILAWRSRSSTKECEITGTEGDQSRRSLAESASYCLLYRN